MVLTVLTEAGLVAVMELVGYTKFNCEVIANAKICLWKCYSREMEFVSQVPYIIKTLNETYTGCLFLGTVFNHQYHVT